MIRAPTDATLRKYGLPREAWAGLLAAQGGVCAICGREPPSGRLVIDHEHVPKWKRLAPNERRRYVRGLLCWTCNHWNVSRYMTPERAARVFSYLESYANRRIRECVRLQ